MFQVTPVRVLNVPVCQGLGVSGCQIFNPSCNANAGFLQAASVAVSKGNSQGWAQLPWDSESESDSH